MKDEHTYGEKMARNGRTKDIYKGTFVCIQTLCVNISILVKGLDERKKKMIVPICSFRASLQYTPVQKFLHIP